jgi:predicted ATPase
MTQQFSESQADTGRLFESRVPAPRPVVAGLTTRMVGRDAELQRLLEEFYGVVEQQTTRMVTIVGEPGIGKSRLLYEFRQRLTGLPDAVQILQGRSDKDVSGIPFGMVRSALAYSFQIRDSDSPELARQKFEQGVLALLGPASQADAHILGYLLGFDFGKSSFLSDMLRDTRQIHQRGVAVLRRFLSALSRTYPLVVFVEDMQWTDHRSLDVLEDLLRRPADMTLLVVCLSRQRFFEQRPDWAAGCVNHVRLDLRPLNNHYSHILIADILRNVRRLPIELRNLIAGQSTGNPFYIEELIKMLIADRVIVPGKDYWDVQPQTLDKTRIPPTLSALISSRLSALTPDEQIALERAAVMGTVFWDSAVIPDGNPAPVLDRLLHRELIGLRKTSAFAGAHEYFFPQSLARDVFYNQVPAELRRRYHADAAEWLIHRAGERIDEYAAMIAGHCEQAGEIVPTVDWYLRAADHARYRYAGTTARGYYQRALALLPTEPDYPDRRLRILRGLGRVLTWQARFEDATAVYEQIQQLAEQTADVPAQLYALTELARVQHEQLHAREVLAIVDRAESLARSDVAFDLALVEILILKGWALHRLSDPTVVHVAEEALQISMHLHAHQQMAHSFSLLGAGYGLCEEHNLAKECNDQALILYRSVGDRRGEAMVLNSIGETAAWYNEWQSASELFLQSLEIARQIGNRNQEATALINLARIRLNFGDVAAAEADVRNCMRLIEGFGRTRWAAAYTVLAEIHLAQGDADEAMGATRQALELAQHSEDRLEAARAWRILGKVMSMLPEGIGAPACFERSVQIFGGIGQVSEQARSLQAWSSYEARHGSARRSQELALEAHQVFVRLGLEPNARSVGAG